MNFYKKEAYTHGQFGLKIFWPLKNERLPEVAFLFLGMKRLKYRQKNEIENRNTYYIIVD